MEDDRESLDLLSNWLSMEGYEVEAAATGAEALERVRASAPAILLLDLVIPPPDGLSVLRTIKENPATTGIPLVVMTVKRDVRTKIECLNNGADEFIAKPFHFDELDAVLRSALRKRKQSYLAYERAIRDLEEANQKLARLTVTDERTSLFNERHLKKRLEEEFEVSQRYGAPLSTMILDLDHFKQVNDRYGHDAGDLVLREFAQLLSENARGIDIVGRFGGEEFLMILRNTDAVRAAIVGERIRRAAEDRVYRYDEYSIRVTVSAGIASVPVNQAIGSDQELIKAADDALRRAKTISRNKVIVDPSSLPRDILEGDLSSIFKASREDGLDDGDEGQTAES